MEKKIYCIGTGPGDISYLTSGAREALEWADVLIGYGPYFSHIASHTKGKEIIKTGMKKERGRARRALEEAAGGRKVTVISSGDAGVYGMAPLLWEMKKEEKSEVIIEVIPGISSMLAAAARLGAPLGHDFCSISLSDLLTPWENIEKRIHAAAASDFVTVIFNPVSRGRFWQLMRLKEIFLQAGAAARPTGIVRNVGRKDESVKIIPLEELEASALDMFTLLIIGNSQSFTLQSHMVTPRGYYRDQELSGDKPGRKIMNHSFRKILEQCDTSGYSLAHIWLALHCIHTTADFSFLDSLELRPAAVEYLYKKLHSGSPPVIISDVSMVTRGIRRGLVEKLGLQLRCYIDDERTWQIAETENTTRAQAAMRVAAEAHPEGLFVIGNAPTALMELVRLIRNKEIKPTGVIAAPVGFVNVEESKWQFKYGCPDTPAVIVHGRKGGSNVAATLVNAILSRDEAESMHPGEGL